MNSSGDNAEPDKSLLELAKEKFGNELTLAEERMFEKTEQGKCAEFSCFQDCTTGRDGIICPPTIHADRIQWLCTHPQAKQRVTDRGISVKTACVKGDLDLECAIIPFPLIFKYCAFTDTILLQHAKVRALVLDGSRTKCIIAAGVKVDGPVCLRKGFFAEGEVCLSRASIDGDLDCCGGTFSNPGKYCLKAEGVKVQDNLFLRDGFEARGWVTFRAAHVESDFHWRGVTAREKATMDLCSARIGTLEDDEDSWPSPGNLVLDGLVYDRISRHAPLDAKSRIDWLRLQPSKRFPKAKLERIALELKGHESEELAHRRLAQAIIGLQTDDTPSELIYRAIVEENAPHPDVNPWVRLDEELRKKGKDDVAKKVRDVFKDPLDPLFLPQPYEQLAKVLKEQGHEEEAKKVLIEKNKDRVKRGPKLTCPEWLWFKLIGPRIEYGYRPLKPWRWCLFFLVLGWVLFCLGGRCGLMTPSNVDAYDEINPTKWDVVSEDYPKFSALVYSLDAFVPIIDFHQQNYWLPNANLGFMCQVGCIPVSCGWFLRLYLWFHIAMGWGLTTLIVGGLTAEFIRS